MQKILGEAFAAKCARLLKVKGATMHSVARYLECSPSTVYRATGGRKRVVAHDTTKWVEATRKARAKSDQGPRNVGQSKETIRRSRGTGKRGVPTSRKNQQAHNTRRHVKAKRIEAKRAAFRAS